MEFLEFVGVSTIGTLTCGLWGIDIWRCSDTSGRSAERRLSAYVAHDQRELTWAIDLLAAPESDPIDTGGEFNPIIRWYPCERMFPTL